MSDYTSRKFIVTCVALTLGTAVTLLGLYFKAEVNAGFYLLLTGSIAAYNWANVRQGQDQSDPDSF